MARQPQQNEQFGRKIGVDDTGPPEIAHGQRVAEDSRMVDDPNQPGRARFVLPLAERPPAEEASAASQSGLTDDETAPQSDAAQVAEGASVWDASPASADVPGPAGAEPR
jgi:hypothetical protein